MDDEELTQDVLDQFDLVCTQFSVENKEKGTSIVVLMLFLSAPPQSFR